MENKTKKIIERLNLGTTAVTLLTRCLELWKSLNKTSKEIAALSTLLGLETIEELKKSKAEGKAPREQRRDVRNLGRRWLKEPKDRDNGRALFEGVKKAYEKKAEQLKEVWKDESKEINTSGELFNYFEERGKEMEEATATQLANAMAKIWMNSLGIEKVKDLKGISIGMRRKMHAVHVAIWRGGDLIETIKKEEPTKWMKILEVCEDFEEFAEERKEEEERAAKFFENLPDQVANFLGCYFDGGESEEYKKARRAEVMKELLNALEMMMPNSEKIRLLDKISKSETERKNAKNYYKIMKKY